MKAYAILFCLILSASVEASSVEIKNLDYLIKKLDSLKKHNSTKAKNKRAIDLRLAHVLALASEKNFLETNCRACRRKGKQYARRALSMYSQFRPLLKSQHSDLYVQILFSISHLNKILNKPKSSIRSLKELVQMKLDTNTKTRAQFQLGQAYYDNYSYKQAYRAFDSVVKTKNPDMLFASQYKKIWSLYRLSQYKQAIQELENFLKSPEYSSILTKDLTFKDQLEKDMLSFYSRSQLSRQQVLFLYKFNKRKQELNTKDEKQKRLYKLAFALGRVGRVNTANLVWQIYIDKTLSQQEIMQARLQIARNNFLHHKKRSFKMLLSTWDNLLEARNQTRSCNKKICEDVQKNLKEHLGILFKSYKKSSYTRELLDRYVSYSSLYKDFDMKFKTAALAKQLKKYTLSQKLFQQAYLLASHRSDKERSAFFQMEAAELSKQADSKKEAYAFYLEHGTDPKRIFQIKYQQAYLNYEQEKNYKLAAYEFKDLALLKNKLLNKDKYTRSLQLKSAHLALSSLSLSSKNPGLMEEWSGRFASEFPKNKSEFLRIYHTAILNSVKSLLEGRDFSQVPTSASKDKSLKRAWAVLNRINSKDTNKKERKEYYMNRLLIAKELLKLDDVEQSIEQLLKLSLDQKDKQTTLSWKLWLAELRFDFKEVFRLLKVLTPKIGTKEQLLRLAHFALFSGYDYMPFYKKIIKNYSSSENLHLITQMLDLSPKTKQQAILLKYSQYFSQDSEALNYLAFKLDAGSFNVKFLKPIAQLSFMKNSYLNEFLKRKDFIENLNKMHKRVERFKLVSNKNLTTSLKKYADLIFNLEKQVKKSLSSKDWISQAVSLSYLESELIRFYNSTLELPLPKGLTEKEKLEYRSLLVDHMAPYKKQIQEAGVQLKKLWSKSLITKYFENHSKSHIFYPYINWEILQLKKAAPKELQSQLSLKEFKNKKQDSKQASSKIFDDELNQAYLLVRKDPFNKTYLKKLLELERSKGSKLLSDYIQTRWEQI